MDSFSLNKTQGADTGNQQVSFTGQKSIIKETGAQKFRFFAPPYDKEKYSVAVEIVPVKFGKDANGQNTEELVAAGKPVLLKNSMSALKYGSYDLDAKDANLPKTDMVGYRFVLIDNNKLRQTRDIEASRDGYLLDSGNAALDGDEKFSYFSKRQGFVNKSGPMYHIFPDSYNVKDGEDFVRNHFNKAGGNIQGIIEKLNEKDSELEPYEMIISTPLFGADDISSHGYWTMNPFQIASSKGTLEDFKQLQNEMFDHGKTYVADGAFTSQSFEGPQLQHVLKWGKQSPFYNWFKLDVTDAPNSNIKLGVFPDPLVTNSTDENSEDYKKAELLKENTAFKVVNPKFIEADGETKPGKTKTNPDYDPKKPTYIQFYDKRLAGAQGDDLKNLITNYGETGTTENHYDVSEHQDSVQPFYFEVDPNDNRFKTKGATLKELNEKGYVAKDGSIRKGYDAFFQMDNYTITNKGQAGGTTTWDGNVDLIKMNISNPKGTNADVKGNKQVKNYFYNIASYWTKVTNDSLMEHIAKNIGEDKDSAFRNISSNYDIKNVELDNIYSLSKAGKFNSVFENELSSTTTESVLKNAVTGFPLESVEFAPDLTAVLSTEYITPRPKDENADDRLSKAELLAKLPKNDAIRSLYEQHMNNYLVSILGKLDAKMPADKKLFEGGNIARLTDYGKAVADIASADIMKYGTVKGLFPDAQVTFDENGAAQYDPNLKYKGVVSLGINEPGAEYEARAVLSKLKKGFDRVANEDNTEFVNSLYTRFKGVDLAGIVTAKAVINRTGSGLNWRFDAAKDVADLDQRRALNPQVSFEDCWDGVIDFWGGFIEKIRDVNPGSYVIAEVTDLWSFYNQKYAKKTPEEIRKDFGKYVNPDIAERMLYDKTGATTGSNYSTFYGLFPEFFGQNYEHGTTNWQPNESGQFYGRLYSIQDFIQGNGFSKGVGEFFKTASPQFINHNHIFVNNHDKPRPFHCVSLDMELFLSDLNTDKAKAVAKEVTGSDDFDHMSSMGVAVGQKYLEIFKKGAREIGITENSAEMQLINKAIADLTMGKFLNHTKPDMQRSRAFGFSPFDITMKDVIQQARYIAKQDGVTSSLSNKKPADKRLSKQEQALLDETFNQLSPEMEKLTAMFKTMMFTVGVPTLFAGDEMAHSGYETPTKNIQLAIRNIIHHDWINTSSNKRAVKEMYKQVTGAAKIHKDRKLSALADGMPLIVPQGDSNYGALYKYNDRDSEVLVVYSNKRMDRDGMNSNDSDVRKKHAMAPLKDVEDKISSVDLEYMNPQDGAAKGIVGKNGDLFKKMEYKNGKYIPSKETYIIKDGKLYPAKMINGTFSRDYEAITDGSVKIELDDVANVFYKVK